jgi:DHA1 family multidrug resistance protein-like MFS transporter
MLIPQAFVKVWWQLAILRFVMGMTLAGLLPSIAKMIRHSVAEGASGKVLGYSQSAQFSGQVLGPLLGGFIGAHLGMRAVFVATSGMLLLGAGLNGWAYRFVSGASEG